MATDRELLNRIGRSPGQRAGYKQLVRELGLGGGRERRLLQEQLARLTLQGALMKTDDQWSLPKTAAARSNLIAGRLDLHRDGYGFVRPQTRTAGGDDDIFVPTAELHGAMQGDQVLVEPAPPRAGGANAGRRFGRIVQVVIRRNTTVVGRFQYARGGRTQGNYVVPFDERMTQPILIPFGDEHPAFPSGTPHRVIGEEAHHAQPRHAHEGGVESEIDLEGLVVDVEITDWPTLTRPARGRVIEVLGDPDDFGVDVEIVIRKHHLPHIFPEQVLQEARDLAIVEHQRPESAHRKSGAEGASAWTASPRRDFRELPIVTIDGETARDFDDAVLVRETEAGYELQVHIADVAQYVTPGSALDLEAHLRGTSVYFPDRAVPMLPQELSSDICSLRPDEDRLVLSCIVQLDGEGAVLSYEVCEGVIRSAQRMTYTQVHLILSGDQAVRRQFAPLVLEFERMHALALILNRKRERRGSIDFDLPEAVIEFDAQGLMQGVVRGQRTWANRLIEEFMLAANECVASWHQTLGVPSLYRIHEKPEARRVIDFEEIAAHFGYSLGLGALPVKRVQFRPVQSHSGRREFRAHNARSRQHAGSRQQGQPRTHEIPQEIPVTPQMYQKLAAKIAGKPEERIPSHLILRSLKQARYSEKNEGHFALATPAYTHFTSPIRRYPDLIVHRVSKALLHGGVSGRSPDLPSEQRMRVPHPSAARVGLPSPYSADELANIAKETSDTERRAAEAERELLEWKKVKFMQDRIGEDFDAMVMNATKYGLFVELNDLFIEGLVPIDAMQDDLYTYRENTRQIIGTRHGRRFTIGDRLRVVLDRVDTVERRLQFSMLPDEHAPQTKRPASKTKKARKKAEQPAAAPHKEKSGKAKKLSRKDKGKKRKKRPS
ncbi:MAG: ribonuclease R family protein [Acidobacteriaceae bacterium]